MLSDKFHFTKENIDVYLKAIAKEYKKQVGNKMPAEIIIIGGAAVLINYGFREMTTDVDALIFASSSIKDAINKVGMDYALPVDWFNEDFKRTVSYTPKIVQFSKYYKTFYNVVTFRTVADEYLIAMKLRSGRQYKNDLSDIIGVLIEKEKNNLPLSLNDIKKAVVDLYGDWSEVPEFSRTFIEGVMLNGNYQELYGAILEDETTTRTLLIDFEKNYKGVVNQDNVGAFSETLRKNNQDKPSVFDKIQEIQNNVSDKDKSVGLTLKNDIDIND